MPDIYGMQIQDQRLGGLVKRVLTLAAIAIIFQVASGIYSLTQGGTWYTAVFAIGCGLIIPACGYFGAKMNNANLMCLFCGCSAYSACCAVFSMIMLVVVLMGLQALYKDDLSDMDTCGSKDIIAGGAACAGYVQQGQCHETAGKEGLACCKCLAKMFASAPTTVAVSAIFALPGCCLSLANFWFGKQLHAELSNGVVIVAPPGQVATQQIMLQPQLATQA